MKGATWTRTIDLVETMCTVGCGCRNRWTQLGLQSMTQTDRVTNLVTVKSALTLLVAVGTNLAAVAANNQVWLQQTVEGSLFKEGEWKALQFKVEQEEKFDENRFVDSETLVMLGWRMNSLLGVYLGDRWVYERSNGKGKLNPEQRPTLDVCLNAPEFWTLKFDFQDLAGRRMSTALKERGSSDNLGDDSTRDSQIFNAILTENKSLRNKRLR